MAYNRLNILTRIVIIQEITMQHTAKGVTQEWVYSNLVFPTYRVSRRTYYNYLGTPAKMELKKIDKQPKQMQLF
jgi:hypothetical protein